MEHRGGNREVVPSMRHGLEPSLKSNGVAKRQFVRRTLGKVESASETKEAGAVIVVLMLHREEAAQLAFVLPGLMMALHNHG